MMLLHFHHALLVQRLVEFFFYIGIGRGIIVRRSLTVRVQGTRQMFITDLAQNLILDIWNVGGKMAVPVCIQSCNQLFVLPLGNLIGSTIVCVNSHVGVAVEFSAALG